MTFSKVLRQSLVWRSFYFITLFLVNIVLSRYLQADGSGVIYYITNTFVFVQLIAGLCLENGITYFAAGRRIPHNKLLWLCLLWTGMLVLIQWVVFHFFSFTSHDLPSQQIAQYAFCFITGSLLIIYSSNIFFANGNFFISNVTLSVFNLAFVIYVIVQYGWLRKIGKDAITDAYFYLWLLQGLSVAFICILKNKSWREFSLPTYPEIKKFTSYSLAVLLFNALLFFVYRVDYYFVKYSPVCTLSDLGNYIQASKLGQMMLIIPQIIGGVLYPQVSSGKDMETVSRTIILLIKLTGLAFVVFFIVILLIGSQLFPFLFGYTFNNVQAPFLVLLPGILGLSIISYLSNYFSGQGNVSISVRSAAVALVIVLSGDFLFVSRYGMMAAATVSMIGYLVMCSPYLILFAKQRNLSFQSFFSIGKEDRLLFISLLKR